MLFALILSMLLLVMKGSAEEACTQESILKCNAKLAEEMKKQQFSFTEEHLDYTCGLMKDVVNCSTYLLEQCNSKSIMRFYDYLTGGTRKVIPQLCEKGMPLRNRYIRNFDCFRNNSASFTACSVEYYDRQSEIQQQQQTDQKESLRQTCCAFYVYTECTRKIPATYCNQDAIDLVEDLFIASAKPMISLCSFSIKENSDCANITRGGSSIVSSHPYLVTGLSLLTLTAAVGR